MDDKNTINKVVNIGTDQESVKISSIGEMLSQIMKISPEFLERGAPEGSTDRRVPDLKLIKDLGNYVSEVSFSSGIIKTYDWYNKRYK
jgi:nucleoside-diphosphate-sugar epimerase